MKIYGQRSDNERMVALWIVIGLVVSAVSVSTLAAAFSVSGLSQLFSGAAKPVIAMSASLELSKFVLAAYLHQTWTQLNILFKTYLLAAIVVLSLITSMGVFGFLSDAYQSTTTVLDSENIKITALRGDLARVNDEIARVNKSVDEIPVTRITKRMQARNEAEPVIANLRTKADAINAAITEADLRILEVKKKVGPLIYISRAFKLEIDNVVKYLIMTFVFVFDPLAICLVLATSQALLSRRQANLFFGGTPAAGGTHFGQQSQFIPNPFAVTEPLGVTPQAQAQAPPAPSSPTHQSPTQQTSAPTWPQTAAPPSTAAEPIADVIQMRLLGDEKEKSKDDDKNAV